MNQKELIKALSIIGEVKVSRWQTVRDIVAQFSPRQVIRKEWLDQFQKDHPDLYPLDLSDIETWSTYESCVDLSFQLKDRKLHCDARIYEGESMSGNRTDVRFEADLKLPIAFIRKIKSEIEYSFDNFLSNSYDEHLRRKRIAWINNLKEEILKL
jgi:hypothetical protein